MIGMLTTMMPGFSGTITSVTTAPSGGGVIWTINYTGNPDQFEIINEFGTSYSGLHSITASPQTLTSSTIPAGTYTGWLAKIYGGGEPLATYTFSFTKS